MKKIFKINHKYNHLLNEISSSTDIARLSNDSKTTMTRLFKNNCFYFIVFVVLFLQLMLINGSDPVQPPIVVVEPVEIPQKLKDRMSENKVLDCLLILESQGDHNKIILDINNKYSVGGYQFQVETIRDIQKRLKSSPISRDEAIILAKSPIEARELARELIYEHGLWYKWSTSFGKMTKGKCSEITAYDIDYAKNSYAQKLK